MYSIAWITRLYRENKNKLDSTVCTLDNLNTSQTQFASRTKCALIFRAIRDYVFIDQISPKTLFEKLSFQKIRDKRSGIVKSSGIFKRKDPEFLKAPEFLNAPWFLILDSHYPIVYLTCGKLNIQSLVDKYWLSEDKHLYMGLKERNSSAQNTKLERAYNSVWRDLSEFIVVQSIARSNKSLMQLLTRNYCCGFGFRDDRWLGIDLVS